MPRITSKRTAVTAKKSLKSHPKVCPCKKCTAGKHDPTCTCTECGHNRLLTKAKRSKRGHKKQDGERRGRVYLGMIDDESYYSPPVVAAAGPAAAAPAAPGPGTGAGGPLAIPALPASITAFTTFPTYDEIFNLVAGGYKGTDLKNLITNGGGTPASGAGSFKANKNLLIQMYYTGQPLVP